jgi:signal transduction histidine kinase
MSKRAFGSASLTQLRVKIVVLVAVVVTVVIAGSFSIVVWMQHSSNVAEVYEALEATLSTAADELGRSGNTDAVRPPDTPDENGTPPNNASSVDSADSATTAPSDNSSPNQQPAETNSSSDELLSNNNLATSSNANNTDENNGLAIGRWRENADMIIPAAVYFIDESGTFTYMSQYSTANLDTDDIDSVIQSTLAEIGTKSSARGFLKSDSLYFVKLDAAGGTLLAFADGAIASQWQYLALTLALVGVCIVALAIVGSTIFARLALRPIEEAWARQQRFIADASHELKTPLSVILANTSIELEHPDSTIAEQAQWIENTHTQAIRMQTLVHEMLELAQADANAISGGSVWSQRKRKLGASTSTADDSAQEAIVAIDLSDIAEGCALTFEPMMFEAKVNLQTDIEPGVTVAGDTERFTRLVSILLDNASKYTPVNGDVYMTLKVEGRNCILSVANTSTPMTKEQIDHVFDRFYKADPARSDASSYGLGLAIAQEITRSAGGKIEVAASPELPGNTFTITLPCA